MRIDRITSLVVLLAAALATACGSSRPLEEGTANGGNCTGCHGGKDNLTGAPPTDTKGQDASPAVGAHTTHIQFGVACNACHVVPQAVSSPGHMDGRVEVTFGDLATANGATPTYSRQTCSGTYCHGATIQGGAKKTVDWNADRGRLDCTSCHGYPPVGAGPHVASPAGANCSACHPATVNPDQSLKQGGKHLSGSIDTTLVAADYHPAGWATPVNGLTPHGTAANYHDRTAFPNGLFDCRSCHGDDLRGGVVGVSCDSCHTGGDAWRANCTFCHGTTGRQNEAAPPLDTLGRSSPSERGVGAHQTHLAGRSTTPVTDGVQCQDCHRLTANIDAHVNGTAITAPDLAMKQPGTQTVFGAFNDADASCATTYCHGNFTNGKGTTAAGNRPIWTQTSGQSDCGTCHSAQTGTDASWGHIVPAHQAVACALCHVAGYGTTTDKTLVNRAEHVNGSLNISGAIDTLGYSTTTHTCANACHGPIDWRTAAP
jgi:predicted CxxxxCH...CXXCH cytochrome family protein